MEGKKKSGKALLEEKQMKRYFRSIKRSKGKIKKESPKKNSDIEVNEEKPKNDRGNSDITKNQVTTKNKQKATTPIADKQPSNLTQTSKTIETEKINQDETPEELVEITAVPKIEQTQLTAVVNNPSDYLSDNLDDWEIVQYPDENKKGNGCGNQSGPSNDKGDVDDVLSSTTDQNNAWVQEMNKINDSVHTTIVQTPLNTSEGIESQKEQLENDNQMQEFSPILYWKDPLPDIALIEGKKVQEEDTVHTKKVDSDVEQKNANVQNIFIEDLIPPLKENGKNEDIDIAPLEVKNATKEDVIYIEDIISDGEQKNAKIQNVFLEDIIPLLKERRKKEGTFVSKTEQESVDEKKNKEINADMLQTVWLDKSRYEDAEMKYHKNLETQQEMKEIFNQSDKCKNANKKKKKTREKIMPVMVGPHSTKESETKLSLEVQVKNLESENSEFRMNLAQLSELVKGLEERVTNLEDRSQSCSLTDEGVDMTEESKCTFFNDCICNYEVAEEPVQILDNISLNDGSEFEEFIATTASDNSDTAKDNLWQEDWDDISGCDLATELRKNCRKTKA